MAQRRPAAAQQVRVCVRETSEGWAAVRYIRVRPTAHTPIKAAMIIASGAAAAH